MLQTNTLDTANADGSSTRIAFDSMATVQGGNVHLDAGRDLRASGGTVTALNDLVATAGRNIALEALAGYYQIRVATPPGTTSQAAAVSSRKKTPPISSPPSPPATAPRWWLATTPP